MHIRRFALILFLFSFALAGWAAGTTEPTGANGLPSLRMLIQGDAGANYDLADNPSLDAITERTGYQLEIETYPPEQGLQKLNLVIASGDAYDMVRMQSGMTSALFSWIENDALLGLSDLIDEHGPNLRDAFPESVWETMTIAGDIYALPQTQMPRHWNGVAIRTDWLETLGLEVPTTLDEMYDVLVAFKERDPAGVGSDRVIPLSLTSGLMSESRNLLGSFGLVNEWVERDGRLVNRVETDEFKDYLSFMRRLYAEGLLDADLPVNSSGSVREKITSNLVGMSEIHWSHHYRVVDYFRAEEPGASFDYIETPAGSDGLRQAWRSGGIIAHVVVPRSAEHPEHVIRFADAFVAPENFEYLYLGEEGVHWEFQDGERVPINPAFDTERGPMFAYQPVSPGAMELPLWLTRVNKIPTMGESYRAQGAVLSDYFVDDPLQIAFYLPITGTNAQALGQMVSDKVLVMIVGDEDIEDWDEFVAEWRAAGGAASTAEINEWYQSR
jgi:putative aldouronate transport system substrate-binding protein